MIDDPTPGDDGLILYDKPAGSTSHDVVAEVRRAIAASADRPPGRRLRVGHAGTLDPFATGLLLVLVGRATRAQRYLMALPKRYEVVARLGWASSTGDPEGELTHTGRVPASDAVLPTGTLRQRPPAYSAVKVDGERAYRRARRGETVETTARDVVVHRFKRTWTDGEHAGFVVECSSGTYVRALIAELGDAYCLELRRTAIGHFDVADADPAQTLSLSQALAFLPERRLGADEARSVAHGLAVTGEADGPVRLVDDDGIVAIGEPRAGTLKPVVGFRG
ncbi:MAG: tRNA pseudouridine(55) synthase TruB [Solirubrobacteraceae bacterium]|nr:MAG: tRNA pseudouridine(55) synthase TruB [Solirubrobacterales bacterium]